MEYVLRIYGVSMEKQQICDALSTPKVKRYYFVHNSLVILNIYANFAPQL